MLDVTCKWCHLANMSANMLAVPARRGTTVGLLCLLVVVSTCRALSECPPEYYQHYGLKPCSELCSRNMPPWEDRNCRTHCPETYVCVTSDLDQDPSTNSPSSVRPQIGQASFETSENSKSSLTIPVTVAILVIIALIAVLITVVVFLMHRRRTRRDNGVESGGSRDERVTFCARMSCVQSDASLDPDAGRPLSRGVSEETSSSDSGDTVQHPTSLGESGRSSIVPSGKMRDCFQN